MNAAKHRNEPTSAAERYGRHSQANADVPVYEVLQQAIDRGDAIRLAWPDDGSGIVSDVQELPTAVLPVIRPRSNEPPENDEDSAPLPPPDDLRQRARPADFSWWPRKLAG